MNTSHNYQPQGYTLANNNTPVDDPLAYTRSPGPTAPVGHDGGPGSISEHWVSLSNSMIDSCFLGQTPQNARVNIGGQNAATTGQQVAPTLQQSLPSRGSVPGREWNASHQPSQVRSGNAASLHNISEQHHYVHGVLGNYRALPCRRVPALMFNNSSSTSR